MDTITIDIPEGLYPIEVVEEVLKQLKAGNTEGYEPRWTITHE